MEKKEFLVPEYYTKFVCKCGECRECCCSGWGITIGINEYFRLLGINVSPELRAKLDCALKTVEFPTRERYAQLGPGWDMRCPLQAEDGLCRLQCEAGETVIPEICRIYPRAYREAYAPEASMSGSCERVIEMLFALKQPMRFEKAVISCEKTENYPAKPGVTPQMHEELRKHIAGILQNRALSFPERLNEVTCWLSPQDKKYGLDKAYYEPNTCETEDSAFSAFRLACGLVMILCSRSGSLSGYLEEAFRYLGLPMGYDEPNEHALTAAFHRYAAAMEKFAREFPDWNTRFEQMFINHVFFTDFPWTDPRASFVDECVALNVTYIAVKFIVTAHMAAHSGEAALVDICAACFRLVEHTAFDKSACSALMIMEDNHKVKLSDAILRI